MTGGGLDSRLADAPHWVYRLFDQDGTLLYAGCTSSIGARLSQHGSKDWWPDVRGIEVEHYPTMREGLDAERAVIEATQPKHNTVFTDKYDNGWPRKRAEDAAAHAAGRVCDRTYCRVGCNEKAHANRVQCARTVPTLMVMEPDEWPPTSVAYCWHCADFMPARFFGDMVEATCWRELAKRMDSGRLATYLCMDMPNGLASEALAADEADIDVRRAS